MVFDFESGFAVTGAALESDFAAIVAAFFPVANFVDSTRDANVLILFGFVFAICPGLGAFVRLAIFLVAAT